MAIEVSCPFMKKPMSLVCRIAERIKSSIRPVRGAYRSSQSMKCGRIGCGNRIERDDWCGAVDDGEGDFDIVCIECLTTSVTRKNEEKRAEIEERKSTKLGFIGLWVSRIVMAFVYLFGAVVVFSIIQVIWNAGVV